MIKKLWPKILALLGAVPKSDLAKEKKRYEDLERTSKAERARLKREVQSTHFSCEHIRELTARRDHDKFSHCISFSIADSTLRECFEPGESMREQRGFIRSLSNHIAARITQHITQQQRAGR